ncbi:MAG: hypothetical protein A4E57_01800 [Syntrophorhabdaceae bacterium PtaU1.Bin034]|nr:MAG: hypothetical protein A4E57_01800 [Syntrophorhabdaceae bacterium PtaU1.Bin034]
MSKQKKPKTIPGGYVALPWKMLNHKAYIKLPPNAKGMLPYFLGKVKIHMMEHQYYHAEFSLTYKEAVHLDCARRTFTRIIIALIEHGFIDPVHWGVRNSTIYRLSKRWEMFGTAAFEPFPIKDFKRRQIEKAVQKRRITVVKNEPDQYGEGKQVRQK